MSGAFRWCVVALVPTSVSEELWGIIFRYERHDVGLLLLLVSTLSIGEYLQFSDVAAHVLCKVQCIFASVFQSGT